MALLRSAKSRLAQLYLRQRIRVGIVSENKQIGFVETANLQSPITVQELFISLNGKDRHECNRVAIAAREGCEIAKKTGFVTEQTYATCCTKTETGKADIEQAVRAYCRERILNRKPQYAPLIRRVQFEIQQHSTRCSTANYLAENWPHMTIYRFRWAASGETPAVQNGRVFLTYHGNNLTHGMGFHLDPPSHGTNCLGEFRPIEQGQRPMTMGGHIMRKVTWPAKELTGLPTQHPFASSQANFALNKLWTVVGPLWRSPETQSEILANSRLGTQSYMDDRYSTMNARELVEQFEHWMGSSQTEARNRAFHAIANDEVQSCLKNAFIRYDACMEGTSSHPHCKDVATRTLHDCLTTINEDQ